jgi:hypothetical protein
MVTETTELHLLITHEQLVQGYWQRVGMMTYHRHFTIVTRNDDGTIVVINPNRENSDD